MGLALLCLQYYIVGEILIVSAYHQELSMNGQPQDTLALAALSPDERTRALER